MTLNKARYLGLVFVSTGLLCTTALPVSSSLGQEILVAQGGTTEEVIDQDPQDNLEPSPEATDASSQEIQEEKDRLMTAIESEEDDVNRLRRINQQWDIGFIVSGILLTLITTGLGAYESQENDVEKRMAFIILAIGALATSVQGLPNVFPVRARLNTFLELQSELTILKFRLNGVKDDKQLEALEEIEEELFEIVRKKAAAGG